MIRLDIDLSFLAKHFEIGTQRINQYGSKNIEEIIEAEAAQGNPNAANFEKKILNNPDMLVRLLKLSSSRNRFAILSNMNSNDLEYMLQFLTMEDLQMGLMFFTKEKLMNLIYKLPKEKICTIVFQAFSVEKFLKLIPEKEIDKFFDTDKLDKDKVLEFVKKLPEEVLNKMVEKFMKVEYGKVLKEGQSLNMNKEQVLKFLDNLEPDKFKTALKCFEVEEKSKLIMFLTQEDPKLLAEFSKPALTDPLKRLDKSQIVQNMNLLEPEDLIKMVDQLPDELLAVVVTQIDPMVFAEILTKNFQDVLLDIGIGNI